MLEGIFTTEELQLLSEDEEERRRAIRLLGQEQRRFDLLEAIAERGTRKEDPEITHETISAAFWLAYHDESKFWLRQLGRMALRTEDEVNRELAYELHGIILRTRGLLNDPY